LVETLHQHRDLCRELCHLGFQLRNTGIFRYELTFEVGNSSVSLRYALNPRSHALLELQQDFPRI
jgi:hypothetical protein